MSNKTPKTTIQEIFGKFAVQVEDGEVKLFVTLKEATAVETEFLKGAEFRDEAAAFCANQGIEGKNAKSKTNILVAYFSWVEAGKPEAPVVEETPVVEDEAVAAEAVADDSEVEF